MHPNREIFSTDRRSDGLSTRPYAPTTLNLQSSGTNNAPGTRFTSPLHKILIDTSQPMSIFSTTSKVLCGITIIANRKHSTATPRACPFLHLVRRYESRHWHHKFHTVQRLRLDSNQYFRSYSTQVLPTLFDARFFYSI